MPVSKQASANAARAALHRLSTVAAVMAAAETAVAANGRGLWDRWRTRANGRPETLFWFCFWSNQKSKGKGLNTDIG